VGVEGGLVVDLHAAAELDGEEDGVFDLVAYVGRSDVVVEALGVVLDDDFSFALALVLAFDKLLFDIVVSEGLHEGTELLFLIVSCGTT